MITILYDGPELRAVVTAGDVTMAFTRQPWRHNDKHVLWRHNDQFFSRFEQTIPIFWVIWASKKYRINGKLPFVLLCASGDQLCGSIGHQLIHTIDLPQRTTALSGFSYNMHVYVYVLDLLP